MVIFDCNGVLVDSEPIVSAVLAESLTRAGFPANADGLARRYHGRRPADVFASVEAITGKKLPPNFASGVSIETLRRFRTELRALPHVAHALTWVRGPKAVASSSPHDRQLLQKSPAAHIPSLKAFRTGGALAPFGSLPNALSFPTH